MKFAGWLMIYFFRKAASIGNELFHFKIKGKSIAIQTIESKEEN